MSAVGLPSARPRPPAGTPVALGVATLYTATMLWALLAPRWDILVPLGLVPFAAALVLLLTRASPAVRLAIGGSALGAFATLWALVITFFPPAGLLPPMLAAAAVVARRFPGATVAAAFAITGSYGSLTAFVEFPAGEAIDVLLAGLWLAAVWGLLFTPRRAPVSIWPGAILVGLYVAGSLAQLFLAESVDIGIYWFRASIWYLAAALLVAYAPWSPDTRRRIVHAVVAVALAVGAYATLRWIIGPAGAERDLALATQNNLLGEELRPIGSFPNAKELAGWCAIVAPFCLAYALVMRDGWRLVAAAACPLLIVGMLSADVRAAVTAVVPALAVVLVLFTFARSVQLSRKTSVGVVAVAALAILGTAAFAVTLGGKEDTGRRYSAIVQPGQDAAFQGRLHKWRTVLADLEGKPFGHGPGTAGRTQKRYGRFANAGSIDVDNSYLKVAYEQGFAVTVFLAIALLLLLAGLARRALAAASASRAAIGIGACGTFVAMLVVFASAELIEGLPALAGWMVVGLGLAQFTSPAAE